jgi:hypothetical protein
VVLQMTVVVWTRLDRGNLGKLQSAGMLTHWRFWRFSDTIKWLLSWSRHGRGSRPGRVSLAPSRGAFFYLVVGDDFTSIGGKGGMLT